LMAPAPARYSPSRRSTMKRIALDGRRRRLQTLSVAMVVAVLVIGALLAACGGGANEPDAREEREGLLRSGADGALIERVRALLRERGDAQATQPGVVLDAVGAAGGTLVATPTGGVALAAGATTVQEPGVDEADAFKSRGDLLYALDSYSLNTDARTARNQLRIARAGADGSVTPLQDLPLPAEDRYPAPRGLLVAATAPRLTALLQNHVPVGLPQPCPPGLACAGSLTYPPTAVSAHTTVQAAELAVGAAGAALGTRLDIDGTLIAARRVGDIIYLAMSHTPRLAIEALPLGAARDAAIAALTAAEVLPGIRVNGGAKTALLGEADCQVQPASPSLSITVSTLVAIDLGTPGLPRAARCYLGGAEALYMSAANLYLATTRSPSVVGSDGRIVYAPTFVTDIHKFSVAGTAIAYRASGTVAGHLGWGPERSALRLSEHAGDLRVLSYTAQVGWLTAVDATAANAPAPSPATLTVLRERTSDRTLQVVATLPNAQRPAPLGKPGEQVYGVRFAGTRGYVVTFRRIDPLYVLDLADPADPRTAGVLEAPGYAEHLLPLDGGLLLGVGRDADANGVERGVKVALFDVRDAARPVVASEKTYGARGSLSGVSFSPLALNARMAGAVARVTLPLSIRATDWAATAAHALHRFEIDTVARTLVERAPLAAPQPDNDWDLAFDRGLQLGDAVFWHTQGRLVGARW
jgi:Beta propeller domain